MAVRTRPSRQDESRLHSPKKLLSSIALEEVQNTVVGIETSLHSLPCTMPGPREVGGRGQPVCILASTGGHYIVSDTRRRDQS